ncbi:hypothetical protein NL108_016225 [Boleophthalmus pectinirostris]|nr:hypothetical protein NL108_016225 [Boleophthalmus pectinirostris]
MGNRIPTPPVERPSSDSPVGSQESPQSRLESLWSAPDLTVAEDSVLSNVTVSSQSNLTSSSTGSSGSNKSSILTLFRSFMKSKKKSESDSSSKQGSSNDFHYYPEAPTSGDDKDDKTSLEDRASLEDRTCQEDRALEDRTCQEDSTPPSAKSSSRSNSSNSSNTGSTGSSVRNFFKRLRKPKKKSSFSSQKSDGEMIEGCTEPGSSGFFPRRFFPNEQTADKLDVDHLPAFSWRSPWAWLRSTFMYWAKAKLWPWYDQWEFVIVLVLTGMALLIFFVVAM